MPAGLSADEVFLRGVSARISPPPVRDDSLGQKQEYWRRRLSYDPFGRFGAPPHPKQARVHEYLHDPSVKVVVVRAGKRAGKSTAAVAEGLFELEKGGQVWVASATLELCKAIFNKLWELSVASASLRVAHKDRAKMRIDFVGGGFLKAVSWAEGTDAIEAEPASLVLGDEFQKAIPEVVDLLRARTMDTGGKMLVLGSEQESSAIFDDLCEEAGEFEEKGQPGRHNWRFVEWATWDNPHIPPDAIEEERARLSPVKFAALYGAQRRPNYTAVYPEFDKAVHVRPLEFLPDEPVTLWIDPGFNFYAVVPVQFREEPSTGETIRVFDQVYLNAATTARVVAECQGRPWWPNVRDAVIDVAARQHRAEGDGKSAAEEWQEYAKFYPRSQTVGIVDGIERLRTALRDPANGRPRISYDSRCVDLIDEYRLYRYRKPREGERSQSETPIDRDNHGLKATSYGLVDRYGLVGFSHYDLANAPAPPRRKTFWDRMRRAY